MLPGCDTVLGDAAAPAELFVTNDYHELPVGSLVGKVTAARLTREWDPEMRCKHFMDDEQLRTRNKQLEAEGRCCGCDALCLDASCPGNSWLNSNAAVIKHAFIFS